MKGSVSTVVDVVFAWGFKKDHLDGTWKKKGHGVLGVSEEPFLFIILSLRSILDVQMILDRQSNCSLTPTR